MFQSDNYHKSAHVYFVHSHDDTTGIHAHPCSLISESARVRGLQKLYLPDPILARSEHYFSFVQPTKLHIFSLMSPLITSRLSKWMLNMYVKHSNKTNINALKSPNIVAAAAGLLHQEIVNGNSYVLAANLICIKETSCVAVSEQ